MSGLQQAMACNVRRMLGHQLSANAIYAAAVLVVIITAFARWSNAGWYSGDDSSKSKPPLKYEYVTCGSLVKLGNVRYKDKRLHSHDVKYGTGSGQQSVTGHESASSGSGSYWRVKGSHGQQCKRGVPVRCGETIRLEHSESKLNLHSHLFPSPMSRQQEISAFGEPRTGDGDTGDNWVIDCTAGSNDGKWRRDEKVALKHADTHNYLMMTGNVFGRPISGHHEIVAVNRLNNAGESHWTAEEGLFVMPNAVLAAAAAAAESGHEEL